MSHTMTLPPEAYREIQADQERIEVSKRALHSAMMMLSQVRGVMDLVRLEDLSEDDLIAAAAASSCARNIFAVTRKFEAASGGVPVSEPNDVSDHYRSDYVGQGVHRVRI